MSRKPIAVALGDIHLTNLIWTNINAVTGDAIVGYKSFLDVAHKLNVPAIIVGDLFDMSKPTSDLVELHRHAMDICKSNGTSVFVLQGNHDKQKTPWATATHEWPAYVGDGSQFSLGEHKATALDYNSMDEIEPSIRNVKTPLLFLHQAAKQALGFENSWNCDLSWIPNCVKLTVLADIHKPFDFTLEGGRKACYTGPGHPREVPQIGQKSVVVIYDDLSYSRDPIPSRMIKVFQVKTLKDVAGVEEWLKKAKTVEGLVPFAWVYHTVEMFVPLIEIQRQCLASGKAIVYRGPLVEDETETPELKISDDEIDPQKLLAKLVDPEKDKELFSFTSEMMDDRREIIDVINARKPC
jgi:hypothetical protein